MKSVFIPAAILLVSGLGFASSSIAAAPTAEVTVSATRDADTSATVIAALAKHPALAADLLSVRTEDGVVYLTGMVDTLAELEEAKSIAGHVAGVAGVVAYVGVDNG